MSASHVSVRLSLLLTLVPFTDGSNFSFSELSAALMTVTAMLPASADDGCNFCGDWVSAVQVSARPLLRSVSHTDGGRCSCSEVSATWMSATATLASQNDGSSDFSSGKLLTAFTNLSLAVSHLWQTRETSPPTAGNINALSALASSLQAVTVSPDTSPISGRIRQQLTSCGATESNCRQVLSSVQTRATTENYTATYYYYYYYYCYYCYYYYYYVKLQNGLRHQSTDVVALPPHNWTTVWLCPPESNQVISKKEYIFPVSFITRARQKMR